MLIKKIMSLDSLEDLTAWATDQDVDTLRQEMLVHFDTYSQYQDANEWAIVVRVCETLAIIGWGSQKMINAIRHYNGDFWKTLFITSQNHHLNEVSWSKRKAGWTIWAYPDPNLPIVDCKKLASQRNTYFELKFIIGDIGGTNKVSNVVAQLKRELIIYLEENIKPSTYGSALEKFYMTFNSPVLTNTPYSSQNFIPRLKVKSYSTKYKSIDSDLFFDHQFADFPVSKQKELIGNSLLMAIDALGDKMKKRKIEYNISALRSDVQIAMDKWCAS